MNNTLTDLVVYSFLVGAILVLTRPGSQGPAFIKNRRGPRRAQLPGRSVR